MSDFEDIVVLFGTHTSTYKALFDAEKKRVILVDPPGNKWKSLTNGMEKALQACAKLHPECLRWQFYQAGEDGVFYVDFKWNDIGEADYVSWDAVTRPDLRDDIAKVASLHAYTE